MRAIVNSKSYTKLVLTTFNLISWGSPLESARLESQLRDLGGSSFPQVSRPTDHLCKAIFIGQMTRFEIKHLFPYMQVGGSWISVLSCLYIIKEPGLCVLASPPEFLSGGQPSLEPKGMQGKICSSWHPILTWWPANVN